MRLSVNAVLITGGCTGIGFAVAEAFDAAGSQAAICARNEARVAAARQAHPDWLTFACDVTEPQERSALLDWTRTAVPKLNILVQRCQGAARHRFHPRSGRVSRW